MSLQETTGVIACDSVSDNFNKGPIPLRIPGSHSNVSLPVNIFTVKKTYLELDALTSPGLQYLHPHATNINKTKTKKQLWIAIQPL